MMAAVRTMLGQVNLHGFRFRIAVSMVSNLLRVAIALITGLLIARVLGPGRYGDYMFLLSSFAALAGLTDMGMSSAFYTLMSQRQRGLLFVLYYLGWLTVQLAALVALVVVAPSGIFRQIWLGQPRDLVLLALIASFIMNQVWAFTGQLGESVRDTVGVQVRNLLAALMFLAVVVVAWMTGGLDLPLLLRATAVIYLLLAVAYAVKLRRKAHFLSGAPVQVPEMLRGYREYFFPSVVVLGFLFTFLDPWLLQRFAGSVQQGYYSVAIRLSSVALLMTAAVIQPMWKEVAEAFAARNMARGRQLQFMCSRGLCFVSAALAGAMLPFAKEILDATLGSAYADAILPFSLLLIYPIYQALHVVNDTVLLAIARAKVRSRIVASYFVVSIVVSYFLVAPRAAFIPGLQLGATGLALKMVVSQVAQANAASYFSAKYLEAPFDWKHQFVVMGVLLPIGYACKLLVYSVGGLIPFLPPIVSPAVSLVAYLAVTLTVVSRRPRLAGITLEQLRRAVDAIWGRPRRA